MDLQQEWHNMNAEFTAKDKMGAIAAFNFDNQSQSLIGNLLFKLKWKLRWIRIINIPILVAALFIKGDLQFLLIAFFLTYEISRIFGLREFKKIKSAVDFNVSTKQVLQANLDSVQRILKMENRFGYIFLPLSGPIGLLAYKLYVHQKIETVLSLPNFPLQFGLLILLGIPALFLTRKMNESIFKAPIQDLKSKIEELSF